MTTQVTYSYFFCFRYGGLGKTLLHNGWILRHKGGQKDRVSPREGAAYEAATSKSVTDKAEAFNSRPNTSKPPAVKRHSVVHSNGVNSGFRIVDKSSADGSASSSRRPPVKLPPVARNMPGSANSTATLVHVNDIRQ